MGLPHMSNVRHLNLVDPVDPPNTVLEEAENWLDKKRQ
jgi:hypothetical protein